MSNLQTYNHFKLDFQKVDQHADIFLSEYSGSAPEENPYTHGIIWSSPYLLMVWCIKMVGHQQKQYWMQS